MALPAEEQRLAASDANLAVAGEAGWPSERREAARTHLVVRLLLGSAAAAVLLISVARAARGIPGEASIAVNHVSGAWTTLAVDFANGELYRPLLSDSGYGGTRYFPLHFVLHGLLIRAGLGPMAAGHVLTLAALVALLAGAFLLLRRSGVPLGIAAPGALLLLASPPMQGAILTIRGDLLTAAFNVCGLAVVLPAGKRPRAALMAAPLFALAILTKQTAVYGMAAAALALGFAGHRRTALKLAALTGLLVCAAAIAVQVASDGRFLQSMLACSSGGASLRHIALAPLKMLNAALPPDVFLVLLGLAGLVAVPATALRESPVALYLIAAGAITLPLFGFPGIDENHFLELDVAVVLFVCTEFSRRSLAAPFVPAALALSSLVFCVSLSQSPIQPQSQTVAQVIEEAGRGPGPLLAENPWIPILAGERPFLLDAFTFKAVSDGKPALRRDLFDRLGKHFFRAVILKVDIADQGAYAGWYRTTHFGPGFTDALVDNYHLVAQHGDQYFVYRPNGE